MKGAPTFLFVVALGSSPALGASEAGEVRSSVTDQLKREFKFDAHQIPEAEAEASSADDAILLPRIIVTDSLRGIDAAIERDRRKKEDEKFSWRNGGTIVKHVGRTFTSELMFKFDADHGLTFLKISW